MTAISVADLTMTYRTPVRPAGLRASIGALFHRRYREVTAVRGISFGVSPGEVVGFIGPNGAGKTTTLKLLSGLLYPTSGLVQVLGHAPWRRDYRFLRQIALLRGSRPLSAPPELTVLDALRFQQVLYDVHDVAFRGNLADLSAMLGLEPLLQRQVRALSLGERMRCGLACALLYRPRVLFLDEPSVGLDVSAVAEVRRFIRDYSAETKATVVLTSHYMADVEALCRRVILIDRGAVAYDGALAQLAERLAPYRLMTVRLSGPAQADWSRFGEVISMDAGCVRLRLPREEVAAITAYVLSEAPVADLAIEEPPLETVIDRAYRQGMEA